MKLAKFEGPYGESFLGEWAESSNDYIRTSEWIDIEFPPLDAGVVTAAKVAAIDAVLGDLMGKIENLRAKKQELLALSYEHQ